MKLAMILIAIALTSPAFAQDQRKPPSSPSLQYAGKIESGEMMFLEATTFGRYKDNGFAWMLIMYPKELTPTWVREVIDCRTGIITDDYIVWLDKSLRETAFSDSGFPNQSKTRRPSGPKSLDQKMVRAACSGKPLAIGSNIAGVRAVVDWAAKQP